MTYQPKKETENERTWLQKIISTKNGRNVFKEEEKKEEKNLLLNQNPRDLKMLKKNVLRKNSEFSAVYNKGKISGRQVCGALLPA